MVEIDLDTIHCIVDDVVFIICLLKEKRYERITPTLQRILKILNGLTIKHIQNIGRSH